MFKNIIALLFLVSSVSCNGQSGLFMRTSYWGGQLNISWLYFTNDGRLVYDPKFGVNPIQIDKEIKENGMNVATFRINGNKMNVKWGDGRTQNVNVEFENGVLSAFDGGLCSKSKPFAFKYFADKTYSGNAGVGNVSRQETLFLGKDGKFRSDRLGAVSGDGNFTGVATSSANDEGTYSIVGNTIIFKYKSGTERRAITQPYDMGKEEIILNNQLYKKQ